MFYIKKKDKKYIIKTFFIYTINNITLYPIAYNNLEEEKKLQ